MFRFTIRDLLWLTVVVAMGVAMWLMARRARDLEIDRKLWETRALQLKGEVESNEEVETKVEFLPTTTNITFGKVRQDEPETPSRP